MVIDRAVKPLRKQMVCRRPTRAELAARAPIVLTPRDQDLLLHVHKHGFLTTDLIELAYFPEARDKRRSRSSCCFDRLRQLWLWNYLDRIEPPIARVLGGRRPYLYTLGRRGVPRVEALLGPGETVQCRRLDRLDDLFVEHDLRAAALWANLRAFVRTSRATRLAWRGERELRARGWRVDLPGLRHPVPVVPDAAFALHYPGKVVQCAFVEVDMGTLPRRRFIRKLAAFERFYEDEAFEEQTGTDHLEVWILAPSRRRLDTLRAAAQEVVPEDRHEDYLFATFDVLRPERFANSDWLYLDGERRSAFFADAFEAPADEEGDGSAPGLDARPPAPATTHERRS